MTDNDRATIASRLRERDETVATLSILVKYAPPFFTVVFVVSAALTILSLRGHTLDAAALVVAIVTAPCVVLAWLARFLIRSLLRNLDLCDHDEDYHTPPRTTRR